MKNKLDFFPPELYMQRYCNNSKSESPWEPRKTDAYEAYCISTSLELDILRGQTCSVFICSNIWI